MKNFLKLLIFSLFLSSSALAQAVFNFSDGTRIDIGVEEENSLRPVAQTFTMHGFRVPMEAFSGLSLSVQEKLNQLSAKDLLLTSNSEYPAFLRAWGITPAEAIDLRMKFIDSAARGALQILQKDETSIVRLLARDTNEVYSRIEQLLVPENRELGLTNAQKTQILNRIRLIPASRPLIASIVNGAKPRENLLALFQLDEESVRRQSVYLLDTGYSGSIPVSTIPVLSDLYESQNLKWRFIWTAPQANPMIGQWSLPGFEDELATKGLVAKFKIPEGPTSFRTALLEHFPKWTGRALSWKEAPTVIMLDIDDTVLKEVDVKNKSLSVVQSVRYQPGTEMLAKYKERLNDGGPNHKTVHFEFLNESEIKSYVAVRPAVVSFLNDLAPLIKAGKVRLLVTSLNDSSRTQAVVNQILVGNKTLAELGAEFVERERFSDINHHKDMGALRRNLGLSPASHVVAIDDLPANFIRSSTFDHVEGVRAFAGDYLKSYLQGTSAFAETDLRDQIQMGRVAESVLKTTMNVESQSSPDMIRVIALAQEQNRFSAKHMMNPVILTCHEIFQQVGGVQ
jgi:hypothetical protein